MPFDHRTRRRVRVAALSGAMLATTGVATFAAFNPALAAGLMGAVTTTSCSVTGSNWCISGNNSSSGIGVIGTSKTGTGLRGTSTSQYGLKTTSSSNYAILAQTTTGKAAISGQGGTGYGVYGFTTGSAGIGVYGMSPGGYGVYATTSTGNGYGAIGYETGSGIGLYGYGATAYGVQGVSSSGTGILGQTGGTGTAVRALAGSGVGLFASNSGVNASILANNANGNAGEFRATYIGVVARTPATGYPLVATDPSGANNLFYVDGAGNVSYKGGLFHFSSAVSGATVKSFTPTAALPTVEDTGTAQLVGGAAVVRLDPTFAASIDSASGYRVFVTANGDTRGLFVATKTPNGFLVRESQGGRSTVAFDYRIVATAAGQANVRMAVVGAGAAGAGRLAGPHAVSEPVPTAAAVPAAFVPPAAPLPAEPSTP